MPAVLLCCLSFLLLTLPAQTVLALDRGADDRIELLNGSVIIGRVLKGDGGKVVVDTDFAGTLSIDQRLISAMNLASTITLQMEDGLVMQTDNLQVVDQTVRLGSSGPRAYALDELLRINPEPWELGRGYRHTGIASSAFSLQRGNTVLDEFDYNLETRWRGIKDRYTMRVDGEIREANRQRVAENWLVSGKYDRLRFGDYYWGLAASAEGNRFADLDLRTIIGPYLGRRFFEGTPFVLEAEGGVSRISEAFAGESTTVGMGLTWSIRSESRYFGADSRLYVDHSGVANFAAGNNLILNTTVGLAFPLLGQLQGATEVVLDYNSGAVSGTQVLDRAYRFRLGYSW